MNKLIFSLILVLVISAFLADAQVYYFDSHDEVLADKQQTKEYRQRMKDNHVRSMILYSWKGDTINGKKILSYECTYDENGNINDYKLYKHGKLNDHYTYKWNSNNKNIEFAWLKLNGKLHYAEQYIYDAADNTIEWKMFWKSYDNNTWHTFFTYDERQNMTESKTIKVKNQKVYERYVYSYYPDGSKKQTVQYDKKGNAEHTWNYDCNPVGKLTDYDLKDSSKICVRYETDKDGNMIKVKEENSKIGNIARSIRKFDSHNNLLEFLSYKANGKQIGHIKYSYDKNNLMTETIQYRKKSDKVLQHGFYKYDNTGMMTEAIVYKNDAPHIYRYDYTKAQ